MKSDCRFSQMTHEISYDNLSSPAFRSQMFVSFEMVVCYLNAWWFDYKMCMNIRSFVSLYRMWPISNSFESIFPRMYILFFTHYLPIHIIIVMRCLYWVNTSVSVLHDWRCGFAAITSFVWQINHHHHHQHHHQSETKSHHTQKNRTTIMNNAQWRHRRKNNISTCL